MRRKLKQLLFDDDSITKQAIEEWGPTKYNILSTFYRAGKMLSIMSYLDRLNLKDITKEQSLFSPEETWKMQEFLKAEEVKETEVKRSLWGADSPLFERIERYIEEKNLREDFSKFFIAMRTEVSDFIRMQKGTDLSDLDEKSSTLYQYSRTLLLFSGNAKLYSEDEIAGAIIELREKYRGGMIRKDVDLESYLNRFSLPAVFGAMFRMKRSHSIDRKYIFGLSDLKYFDLDSLSDKDVSELVDKYLHNNEMASEYGSRLDNIVSSELKILNTPGGLEQLGGMFLACLDESYLEEIRKLNVPRTLGRGKTPKNEIDEIAALYAADLGRAFSPDRDPFPF